MVPMNKTGTVNLSVTSTTEINLTDNTINFGAGYVDGTVNNCTVDSEGNSNGCQGNWASVNDAILIENTGNTDAQIDLVVQKNATGLLGPNSTAASFQIKFKSAEIACSGQFNLSSFTEVGENFRVGTGSNICNSTSYLKPDNSQDQLNMTVKLRIPNNATGTLGSIINITATYP